MKGFDDNEKAFICSSTGLCACGGDAPGLGVRGLHVLHANADVSITGGTLTLAAGDDAVHADNDLVIGAKGSSSTTTPKISITASYEGLEGTTVNVYSGDIDVAASDDGVNAASSQLGERSDKYAINIAGGDLYIDAGSDGLDSNNDITITGGKVEVYGADAMMDAAIDYDGTFTLSGGTLFGAGMEPTAGTQAYIAVGAASPSGGMGGGPNGGQGMTPPSDANGSQMTPPDFSGNGGTPPEKPSDNGRGGQPGGAPANRESALGIKEGSVITVQDSSGKTLYTATALGSMSSVIFSSPDIREGETCTVLVDGASVGTAAAKLGTADSSSSMSTFEPGQGGKPNRNDGQNGGQNTVGGFKDVAQNSWYADAVQYVTSSSLMNGTSSTAFSPNASMSRAQSARQGAGAAERRVGAHHHPPPELYRCGGAAHRRRFPRFVYLSANLAKGGRAMRAMITELRGKRAAGEQA